MNDMMARAFVVHRLNDGQVRALHIRETAAGYLMVPAWIHEHFGTKPWGSVPEATQAKIAPTLHALQAEAEAQARAKGEHMTLPRLHALDWAIRKRDLDFSFGSAGKSRSAVMKGYRPMDEEEN